MYRGVCRVPGDAINLGLVVMALLLGMEVVWHILFAMWWLAGHGGLV